MILYSPSIQTKTEWILEPELRDYAIIIIIIDSGSEWLPDEAVIHDYIRT